MNVIFFFDFANYCFAAFISAKLVVIVDGLPHLDNNCVITKRGRRTSDINRSYLLVHHAAVGPKDATMKLGLIAICLFLLASSGIVSSSPISPSVNDRIYHPSHHPIPPRPTRSTRTRTRTHTRTRTRTTTHATTTTHYETPTPTTEVTIPYMPTTFDSAVCSAYPEICRNAGLNESARTAAAKPNEL